MIEAVRMLLKAGIEKEDTTNAARGLVAVVLARFSGIVLTIPQQDTIKTVIRNIEIYRMYKAGKSIYTIAKLLNFSEPEITTIIEAHPKSPVPGAKELPILRKQLFTMAENFRDKNIEVFSLLEAAADKVMQAHEVIKFAERK